MQNPTSSTRPAAVRPLHLLHIVTSPLVGGPHRQIMRQAERLPADRFRVSLVTFLRPGEGHELVKEATARGLDITGLPVGGPFDLSPVGPLCELIRGRDIEVVCVHDAKSTFLGSLAARRCGVPLIAWARGWTGESLRVRLYDAIHLRMMRRAEVVIAVSQALRETVVRAGVRPERAVVVRNAFSSATAEPDGRLRRQLGLAEEVPLVLSVGRLSPEKGHRYLLAAAELLRQQGRRFALVLVGEGRERARLERQRERLGLRDCVHLLGFRTDVAQLLGEAAVFVLPSLSEGLPNAVLEAFAAGTPVVASAVGGLPEVVEEGETGYLIPPRDPRALADRIAACLQDPGRARGMGEAGQLSLSRYTSEHQMGELAEVFGRVGGRGPDAAETQ